MRFFAVYDALTGAIARAGFCSSEADMALQPRSGEAVIATDRPYDGAKFRIDLTKKPPVVAAVTP